MFIGIAMMLLGPLQRPGWRDARVVGEWVNVPTRGIAYDRLRLTIVGKFAQTTRLPGRKEMGTSGIYEVGPMPKGKAVGKLASARAVYLAYDERSLRLLGYPKDVTDLVHSRGPSFGPPHIVYFVPERYFLTDLYSTYMVRAKDGPAAKKRFLTWASSP